MGIVEDTTKKFHPPISLPTFLLGALLILVGLTAELNFWEFKRIVPDPKFRLVSIIIGAVFVITSIVMNLLYKSSETRSQILESLNLPDDLKHSYPGRLASIGSNQLKILRYIQSRTSNPSTTLNEKELYEHFNMDGSEMYYRLEQLRLLGLITKVDMGGKGKNYYRLSNGYRKEIGLPNA